MSRIGNLPIEIPAGVTVTVNAEVVTVTGPKGTLTLTVPPRIHATVADNFVLVTRDSNDKKVKACHGSTRAHISNMISGVVTLWTKEMEIRGTGYKFAMSGNKIIVNAGYIHTVEVTPVEGVFASVPDESKLILTGADKTKVGQLASNIRKIRKPEPYKGKGIRYVNEFIKLKAGKTAKA